MANYNKYVIFVSAFISLSSAGHLCDQFLDCKSCTLEKSLLGQSCLWCPLDRTCHDYSSELNPCLEDQNVKEPALCREVNHGKYDPRAAFSYVLMSAASYSETPKICLKKIYPETDFEIQEIISKSCETLPLFKYEKCLAFTAVSHSKRVIALSYRGTLVDNLQLFDEIFSVLTIPKVPFPAGGKVQSYFANAHDKIFPDVNASVANLVSKYPSYDVVVTGHSLGGAIASLSAMSLVFRNVVPVNKISLYTYGSPRVGDKQYAFNHDKLVNNSWRVVHYRDVVSHLPTCNLIAGCSVDTDGPYHHGIEIFYPEKTMDVQSQYIECKGDEDMKCSDGLVTKHPCALDILKCIGYHDNYFGVPVGTICEQGS